MNGWARLTAALLALAIAHRLAPYAVVAAAVVVLSAAACVALGWLLAATRHTWGGAPLSRAGGAP